jgi:hypothetical protein
LLLQLIPQESPFCYSFHFMPCKRLSAGDLIPD